MSFEPCPNPKCRYDWSANPLDITLELDAGRLPEKLDLRCPVCGVGLGEGAQLRHLDAVTVPTTSQAQGFGRPRVLRWASQRSATVSIRNAEDVSLDDVLFEGVPVFTDGAGDLRWPTLPVRPEYLALVDLDACRARIEKGGVIGTLDLQRGVYVASIPLKGRAEAVTQVERPVIGRFARRTNLPREEAIAGVQLTVWPNIRADRWRTFSVDAELDGCEHLGNPEVSAFFRGRVERVANADEASGGWYKVKSLEHDGYGRSDEQRVRRFGGLFRGGRPDAIAVSFGNAYGGIFLPASAEKTTVSNDTLVVGLDFGTSNTCVAFRSDSSDGVVEAPGDAHEYLLRSRRRGDPIPSEKYSPRFATKLFGPTGDIYPTELLTRERAVDATRDELSVARLRPGLDYTIPGADVRWAEGAASGHLLSGFKWSTEGGDDLRRRWLMKAYIKALLVQSVAGRIARLESSGQPVPGGVQVNFGYPGMWQTRDIGHLSGAIREALGSRADQHRDDSSEWSLADWVDVDQCSVGESKPEAFAAARVAIGGVGQRGQLDGPRYRGILLVDIGGGSTDVAFVWLPVVAADSPVIEYLASLRYAGEDLFRALEGPAGEPRHRCFAANMGRDTLARALRADGATSGLFNPMRNEARDRRVRAFFGQLTEYLARLVAGTVPSQSFARRNGDHTTLPITMVRLGNGWGLSSLINPNIDAYISTDIEQRVRELIADSGAGDVLATVKCVGIAKLQPKHAVAMGLLLGAAELDKADYVSAAKLSEPNSQEDTVHVSEGETSPWVSRQVMGLDLAVKHLGDSDSHTVEWWREVTNMGKHHAVMHGPVRISATTVFDWLPASGDTHFSPDFAEDVVGPDPRAFMRSVAEADPAIRGVMRTGSGWPTDSPLATLLETGLLKRLSRLG